MKFKISNFQAIFVIDGWDIFCEIAHIWMSLDLTDDKSTLMVQVMAWCHGSIWQQAITWANAESELSVCHQMASPGHNELTQWRTDKNRSVKIF